MTCTWERRNLEEVNVDAFIGSFEIYQEAFAGKSNQVVPSHCACANEIKRIDRIHHRTILKRVWPMMHLHLRCLVRSLHGSKVPVGDGERSPAEF